MFYSKQDCVDSTYGISLYCICYLENSILNVKLVQNEIINSYNINSNIKVGSLSHAEYLYKDETLDYNQYSLSYSKDLCKEEYYYHSYLQRSMSS